MDNGFLPGILGSALPSPLHSLMSSSQPSNLWPRPLHPGSVAPGVFPGSSSSSSSMLSMSGSGALPPPSSRPSSSLLSVYPGSDHPLFDVQRANEYQRLAVESSRARELKCHSGSLNSLFSHIPSSTNPINSNSSGHNSNNRDSLIHGWLSSSSSSSFSSPHHSSPLPISSIGRDVSYHEDLYHITHPNASSIQSSSFKSNSIDSLSSPHPSQSIPQSSNNNGPSAFSAVYSKSTEEDSHFELADPFDGQCCRTYPNNHSKIIKWHQQKTGMCQKTSLPSKECKQESGSPTIPIGIAIGRQRTSYDELSSESKVSSSALQFSRHPSANSSIRFPEKWPSWEEASFGVQPGLGWPPLGPIPMGYQLAKDPITGQILLIPTDGGRQNVPPWSFGLHPPPPPPINYQLFHHHQQQQQQQHQRQMFYHQRHEAALASVRHYEQFSKSRHHKTPETIHLDSSSSSTEEDEEVKEKKESKSLGVKKEDEVVDETKSKSKTTTKSLGLELEKKESSSSSNESETQIVVDSLLSLSETYREDFKDGLSLLLHAMDLHEHQSQSSVVLSLDLLCSITENDCLSLGIQIEKMTTNIDTSNKLSLLCSLTNQDYFDLVHWVDPIIELRKRLHLHKYSSGARESLSRKFIESKIRAKREEESASMEGLASLAKVLSRLKRSEVMSTLEIELRASLASLQSLYKRQMKESKSPKKRTSSNMTNSLTNTTTKNYRRRGRPKKPPGKKKVNHDSPPILELEYNRNLTNTNTTNTRSPSPPPTNNSKPEIPSFSPSSSLVLLQPPKLTASSSSHTVVSASAALAASSAVASSSIRRSSESVTNLSTIKAKFMRGKENPFANLMMTLATSEPNLPPRPIIHFSESSTENENDENDDDDDDDEEEKKENEKKKKKKNRGEDEKEEERQTKDNNYFMISASASNISSSSSSSLRKVTLSKDESDEYEFKDDDETETDKSTNRKKKESSMSGGFNGKKSFTEYRDPSFETLDESSSRVNKLVQQPQPSLPSSSSNSSLGEISGDTSLRSATLSVSDLKDGLRFLILNEGRFWAARLSSTQLPDVYGVYLEKQRGNRPTIMPRDDILQEAIMEVIPETASQIPIGSRVCVYWSSAYHCLFPGVIERWIKKTLALVLLDDGDRREVEIAKIRLLPSNYSMVFYDPDPIATLRKRRQSSESLESHHHFTSIVESRDDIGTNASNNTSSSSSMCMTMSSISNSVSPKKKSKCERKKHKKTHTHKHHHHKCNKHHRHKRHKGLRVKLDGIFNNTTTYSIRSPPIYSNRSLRADDFKVPVDEVETEEIEKDEDENENEVSSENEEEEEDEISVSETLESSSGGEDSSLRKDEQKGNINPVTGRPLWKWADEGYRRPGSKGKAKKLFHRSISRENDVLHVGDCAVFLSTARVDRPYIGKVELLWETGGVSSMMVKVKWFYHPEEIETNGKKVDLKVPGGLFQSPHMDENDVQTISHKCIVLPLKEYSRLLIADPVKRKKIFKTSSDTYYLAGNYEPGSLTVQFHSGVCKT